MRSQIFPSWIFLLLYLDICASGVILPVSAQILSIDDPVLALVSQISTSQHAMLEFTLITILLPYLLSVLFLCNASDQMGRTKVLRSSLLISCAGYIVLLAGLYISNIYIPLLGMTFLAMGSATVPICQAFIIDASSGKKKSCYLAMVGAIFSGAYIPSAQLSSHLLRDYPGIIMPADIAIFALGLNLLAIFFLNFRLSKLNPLILPARSFRSRDISSVFLQVFSNKNVFRLLKVLFLFQISWGLYYQNIYYYLSHFSQYMSHRACFFVSYISFVTVFVLIFIYPKILQKFSANNILLTSLLICAITFFLNTFFVNVFFQYLIGFFIASATGSGMVILWNLLSENVEQCYQGFLMGITGIIWIISWAFSSALDSFLNTCYLELPLQVAAIVMLMAALRIWILKPKAAIILFNDEASEQV